MKERDTRQQVLRSLENLPPDALARLKANPRFRQLVAKKPSAGPDAVVDRVADFIERFVFLKTKSTYKLLSLWIVATHMHAEFEHMGYIFACSPEPKVGSLVYLKS